MGCVSSAAVCNFLKKNNQLATYSDDDIDNTRENSQRTIQPT